MEYQILLEMIKKREEETSMFQHPAIYNSERIKNAKKEMVVLKELKNRIDKARESDIIAMSNEGCV